MVRKSFSHLYVYYTKIVQTSNIFNFCSFSYFFFFSFFLLLVKKLELHCRYYFAAITKWVTNAFALAFELEILSGLVWSAFRVPFILLPGVRASIELVLELVSSLLGRLRQRP